MGELEPGDRVTIERDGDGQKYVLVLPELYLQLLKAREVLWEVAGMAGLEGGTGAMSKMDPEEVQEGLFEMLSGPSAGPYVELAEMMQDWQSHITLEWPEGVRLSLPEDFEGDPKPKLRLSDELREALGDADAGTG